MYDYRLYLLDRQGKIVSAEWVAADSDEEALSRARARDQDERWELWHRDRFVARAPRDGAA